MFCLTRRHDFVSYMYKYGSLFTNVEFHSEKQMAVLTKWTEQQLWPVQPRPQGFSLKNMGKAGKGPGIGWSRVQPKYS